MKHFISFCTAVCLVFGAELLPAAAQDSVSADSIVDALKPKGKTRSILGGSESRLTREQSDFIDRLRSKTRQIVVEERKQVTKEERKELTKIVETQKLPSIDLEILFDYNSAEIANAAKPTLIELGRALTDDKLKGTVILLSGHTDASGSAEYNQRLSQARAASVKAFLVHAFGIDTSRLISVGYGEEQLKNTAHPEAAENRRVQIVNLAK